jgi:hypothetical protein
MKNTTKGKVIKGAALMIDVAAPLIATICQFPVWVEKSSSATVSGLFLVFAFLSCLPFLNQIKTWLKSPSVPVLWCVFLVLFALLRNIIDQMWIICLVGVISNCVGSIVYKVGDSVGKNLDDDSDGGSV